MTSRGRWRRTLIRLMPSSARAHASRPFTGLALDRAWPQRTDPLWVARRLEDPDVRAVAADREGVLISDGDSPSLIRIALAPNTERHRILIRPPSEREPVLLGLEPGSCPRCSASHFPRTDPVVIMTVEHNSRLLLGHRSAWPAGRYSLLAGFVAPGESAEEAVAREVLEESGVHARDPVFVTSQPWPFPSQLMLGFEAQADGGEPRADDGELDDVRWFALAAIADALCDGNPGLLLPPRVSIARFLIARWVAARR